MRENCVRQVIKIQIEKNLTFDTNARKERTRYLIQKQNGQLREYIVKLLHQVGKKYDIKGKLCKNQRQVVPHISFKCNMVSCKHIECWNILKIPVIAMHVHFLSDINQSYR